METIMFVLHWANNNGLLLPVLLAVGLAVLRGGWELLRVRLQKSYPGLAERGDVWVERIAALLPDLLRAMFPPQRSAPQMMSPYRTPQPLAEEAKPEPATAKVPTTDAGAGIALMVAAALAGVVGLAACPRLPEQSDCTPGAQRCAGEQPQVCSGSSRWTPIGDISCREVGAVCVHGITAHCRRADAGVQ
jgi:hypothetical protein